jgi:hypothetical protein
LVLAGATPGSRKGGPPRKPRQGPGVVVTTVNVTHVVHCGGGNEGGNKDKDEPDPGIERKSSVTKRRAPKRKEGGEEETQQAGEQRGEQEEPRQGRRRRKEEEKKEEAKKEEPQDPSEARREDLPEPTAKRMRTREEILACAERSILEKKLSGEIVHGSYWNLSRTNKEAACVGCGELIRPMQFRMIYMPNTSSGVVVAAGTRRGFHQYHHIRSACLARGGAPLYSCAADFGWSVESLPKRLTESAVERAKAIEAARELAVKVVASAAADRQQAGSSGASSSSACPAPK